METKFSDNNPQSGYPYPPPQYTPQANPPQYGLNVNPQPPPQPHLQFQPQPAIISQPHGNHHWIIIQILCFLFHLICSIFSSSCDPSHPRCWTDTNIGSLPIMSPKCSNQIGIWTYNTNSLICAWIVFVAVCFFTPNLQFWVLFWLQIFSRCYLCCCIPYCMDSCQNGNHYCPNCGTFIGTYAP